MATAHRIDRLVIIGPSHRFVENAHPGLLAKIREKKTLDDALKAELNNVMKEAKERFKTAAAAAAK